MHTENLPPASDRMANAPAPRIRTMGRSGGGIAAVLLVCVCVASATLPATATAESLLLNPPSGWNGFFVSGTVRAGWKETGGPGSAITPGSSFMLAGPTFPPLTPGQVLTRPPLHLSSMPGSGNPKDIAEVRLDYSVTVGAAGAGGSDKFNLALSGTTSATNARYDFGGGLVPADAFIAVDFFMLTAAPVPAATNAVIGLPALPSLTTSPPNVESLSAVIQIGPFSAPTTITMAPGSGATLLPLVLNTATNDVFQYKFSYQLLTPYGTDPSVAIALEGSMVRTNAVPELGLAAGPLALLLGGLGLLEKTRRRQASS
jgi:hypothetical protein